MWNTLVIASFVFSNPVEINEPMVYHVPTPVEVAIEYASEEIDVPSSLLKAVCTTESNLNPKAFNKSDGSHIVDKYPNHAFGTCQLLYSTALFLGFKGDKRCLKPLPKTRRIYKYCKLFGLKTNIMLAAKLLKRNLDRYNGNWVHAIAAYNAGSVKYCKANKVAKDGQNRIINKQCKKGDILNQPYVDKVLNKLPNRGFYVSQQ